MTSTDPGKEPQGSGQDWICRFRERGFWGKQSHSGTSAPQGSACGEVSPLGAREAQNYISNTPHQTHLPRFILKRKQSTVSSMLPAKLSPDPQFHAKMCSVKCPDESTTSHTAACWTWPRMQWGDAQWDAKPWIESKAERTCYHWGQGSKGEKGQGVTSRQL